MSKPNQNALLDALRKFGKAQARRPAGEGWFTLAELAAEEGSSPAAIKYRILMAQKRGVKFEQANGTALDEEGNAKKAVFWRLKNGTP